MTLQFYINNQTLYLNQRQKDIKLASDSRNYLIAKFTLQTSDWKTGEKVCILFTANGKTYKKELGEDGLGLDECYVPFEVITPGSFTVTAYMGDRITTNMVEIPVLASGYTEDIENGNVLPQYREKVEALYDENTGALIGFRFYGNNGDYIDYLATINLGGAPQNN